MKIQRATRVMPVYQFLLSMILGAYVGFSRLNHLRFLKLEPLLLGILKVLSLPPQCTYWRFMASLPVDTARQLLEVQRGMRERVWGAANVQLQTVTLDTDTTVHTLFGQQMGGRKGYNPKNKGKKSYPPILTFIAETREYLMGELHKWGPAQRRPDRASSGTRHGRLAQNGAEGFGPRGFRILLWGSGAGL